MREFNVCWLFTPELLRYLMSRRWATFRRNNAVQVLIQHVLLPFGLFRRAVLRRGPLLLSLHRSFEASWRKLLVVIFRVAFTVVIIPCFVLNFVALRCKVLVILLAQPVLFEGGHLPVVLWVWILLDLVLLLLRSCRLWTVLFWLVVLAFLVLSVESGGLRDVCTGTSMWLVLLLVLLLAEVLLVFLLPLGLEG